MTLHCATRYRSPRKIIQGIGPTDECRFFHWCNHLRRELKYSKVGYTNASQPKGKISVQCTQQFHREPSPVERGSDRLLVRRRPPVQDKTRLTTRKTQMYLPTNWHTRHGNPQRGRKKLKQLPPFAVSVPEIIGQDA